jgi:hypothetical protein
MNRNFVYAMFLAAGLSMTSCEMDTFNEQDAINAQKELLTLKYTNETELEKLRQTATTALEQLKFTNLLEEIRLRYQLEQDGKNADANREVVRNKQDYTVYVTDLNTDMPLADVDVSVASEGQIKTLKTNASGVAVFDDLALYSSSRFIITKTGFTAASITTGDVNSGPVKLLNIANAKNEVKGKLYVETDLTNTTSELAPENTLVTASTTVPSGSGAYTMQIAARTDAGGNYSLKLPDAPSGYNLSFGQIAADQKLYVNGLADIGTNGSATFPTSLPQLATVKTYFDVNTAASASVSDISGNLRFYFKLPADLDGDVGYYTASGITAEAMASGKEFRLTGLDYRYYPTVVGNTTLKYAAKKDTLEVELVDWTGKYVKDAPKIVVVVDENGNLVSANNQYNAANPTTGNSFTNSDGYLRFKRENMTVTNPAGNTVAKAQGVFKMNPYYEPNVYNTVYGSSDFNYSWMPQPSSSYVSVQGGQTIVRDFYYSVGDSREKRAL